MTLFLTVFAIMLLLVAAMAVGVIFGRKPISGTCGGLNMMGAGGACEICGGDPQRCEAQDDDETVAPGDDALGYDASRR